MKVLVSFLIFLVWYGERETEKSDGDVRMVLRWQSCLVVSVNLKTKSLYLDGL